jgi:hypothetical protein
MIKLYLMLLVVFLLLTGRNAKGNTQQQDSTASKPCALQFGINAGFSNKYMWRGMCYNQGLVFQPEANISYKNFSLSSWSNLTIWDIDSKIANEVDFILTYSNSFFNFDFESSLNYYYFIKQPGVENTAEYYLGLGLPIGDFTLFTGLNIDLLSNPGGAYCELGIAYKKELTEKWIVSGSLQTGLANSKFNNNYLGLNKSAFNLATANAYLTYSPLKEFYIDAHFQQNFTLDKVLTETLLKSNSNYFEIIFRKEF